MLSFSLKLSPSPIDRYSLRILKSDTYSACCRLIIHFYIFPPIPIRIISSAAFENTIAQDGKSPTGFLSCIVSWVIFFCDQIFIVFIDGVVSSDCCYHAHFINTLHHPTKPGIFFAITSTAAYLVQFYKTGVT